jgi:hypothetical protein
MVMSVRVGCHPANAAVASPTTTASASLQGFLSRSAASDMPAPKLQTLYIFVWKRLHSADAILESHSGRGGMAT